jgi:ribosome-associated protein
MRETMDTPEKREKWNLDPEALARDCDVEAVRGGGPGGQHRNKSYTGVRLRHRPSGVVVTATRNRSYTRNLNIALELVADKLRARMKRTKKRVATKVSRGAKRRRLEKKKRRSTTKKLRGRVED